MQRNRHGSARRAPGYRLSPSPSSQSDMITGNSDIGTVDPGFYYNMCQTGTMEGNENMSSSGLEHVPYHPHAGGGIDINTYGHGQTNLFNPAQMQMHILPYQEQYIPMSMNPNPNPYYAMHSIPIHQSQSLPLPIPRQTLPSTPALTASASTTMTPTCVHPNTPINSNSKNERASPEEREKLPITKYGHPLPNGTYRCAHPNCTSQTTFRRACDLRKHYNQHRRHLFCRYEGCPQSQSQAQTQAESLGRGGGFGVGFSSNKDRARHEAKHNPGVMCEWEGCGRVFSRVDNMKDHVRRIHLRAGGRESSVSASVSSSSHQRPSSR